MAADIVIIILLTYNSKMKLDKTKLIHKKLITIFYSGSSSGVSKLHLWTKSSPPLVFTNKVLLAHSHSHLFRSRLWLR